MPKRKRSGYLHGYSKKEQNRLYKQARFLESEVYELVEFPKTRQLLEVGCGVGAQTKILLRRFPGLSITGIDASKEQIRTARHFIKDKRAEFFVQNAEHMSFPSGAFDGAFLCWFLEHVPDPVKILKETRRVLKKGSVIYCNEVQNASFFVEPYSPAILKYWFLFNDEQWMMGGDPFAGAKLGNWLKDSHFKNIEVFIRPTFLDSRDKAARTKFLKYWTDLMLSAAPQLLKSKRATPALIKEVKREINILKRSKDSVFFFIWIQARATK